MPHANRAAAIARARHLVEKEGYKIVTAANVYGLDYGHLTKVAREQRWDRSRTPSLVTLLKRFPWGRQPIQSTDLTEEQAKHAVIQAKKCGCSNVREWLLETLRDAIDEEIARKNASLPSPENTHG